MIRRFLVVARIRGTQGFLVEARSKAEAVRKVRSGDWSTAETIEAFEQDAYITGIESVEEDD